jgi:hypothetical protein
MTIPGESELVVVPIVCTIPPKEDKACTSSVEAPMAHALVAQPGNKAPDDNRADDDPDLLNFDTTESVIICRMSSWLQSC